MYIQWNALITSTNWVATHEILLYPKCQSRFETPQKVFSCPFLINPHTFVPRGIHYSEFFYNSYSCLVEKLINGIMQYMVLCFNIFDIHPYNYTYQYFVSYYFWEIQFSSVAQSHPTLCDPMDCSPPGLPVHHQLLEFTQTHVHWVGDAIQPSHPLSSPSPAAFNLSQHQDLFKWFWEIFTCLGYTTSCYLFYWQIDPSA